MGGAVVLLDLFDTMVSSSACLGRFLCILVENEIRKLADLRDV